MIEAYADALYLSSKQTEAEYVRDSILSLSVAEFTSAKARWMNERLEREQELRARPDKMNYPEKQDS